VTSQVSAGQSAAPWSQEQLRFLKLKLYKHRLSLKTSEQRMEFNKLWNLKNDEENSISRTPPTNFIDFHAEGVRILNITQHNNKLFASINRQGIACSEDTGKTWISINNGLPIKNVHSFIIYITFCEKKIFAAVSSGEGFVGEFVSDDEGKNWRINDNGIPPNVCISNIIKTGNQYAAITSDGGSTFKRCKFSIIIPL
jgi:hypothetical protein